jgi:homoserine kinase
MTNLGPGFDSFGTEFCFTNRHPVQRLNLDCRKKSPKYQYFNLTMFIVLVPHDSLQQALRDSQHSIG